ncbi:hypothetical protein HBI36_184780 [Parastagonospora nodorum]|nr:hypothetical protein HBI36_184780 [Parastagonospora nodorum]
MLFPISCATEKVHVCAADGLSSTVIVYNHIEKDKNADLAIADSISDALDMCAKDDLTYDGRLAGELATAESVTAKDPNYVDTFSSDFAFSLPMARGNVSNAVRNLSREAQRRRSTPGTLLAGFIPTTKIRDPLLKSQVYYYCMGKLLSPLENAANVTQLFARYWLTTKNKYS